MVIKSYGLFWRADEVDWNPGRGRRGAFHLLGRQGKNLPGLRLADFRRQVGIYILYGQYGPHYVGLARKQGIGKRLKDHLSDTHSGLWDRFSWFGFKAVLKATDNKGHCVLKELANVSMGSAGTMIGDMEALLIKAMGLSNKSDMKFWAADEWQQVKRLELQHYYTRLGC